MKMMKKVLALLIIAVMMLTMAACGGNKDTSSDIKPKSDVAAIQAAGKLVVGVTVYEPMNYLNKDGAWDGFDTEFANAVAKKLGVEAQFVIIDWDNKWASLNSKKIDCVWNGMTLSDAAKANASCTDPYVLNAQVVVMKADKVADFASEADLSGKTACVEAGSAGAAYAESVTDKDKIFSTTAQINAFTEVKSGAVDFAVVDIILAQNICGKGDYEDLAIVEAIELDSEIYAVGFKKGSDLTSKVNVAIKELEADGTLMELATKYGFENVLKVIETID